MTQPADSVPSSLLIRARRNEPDAWSRLSGLLGPTVERWVRRDGVPAADAADVTQDVFLEVTRSLDRFRRDRPGDSFLGWLRTIARRRAIDWHRRADPPPAGGTDALRELAELPAPDAETDAPRADATADLVRSGLRLIRDEFEPRTWAAFERTAVDGLPPADAAAELGLSVGAVYVAKSRVLKRLREELDGLIE